MATDVMSILGGLGGLGGSQPRASNEPHPFSGRGGLLGFGEYDNLAGRGYKNSGGVSSNILSFEPKDRRYQEKGGDQLRQIFSGYYGGNQGPMAQLMATHKPGDVILSDQERGILQEQNAQGLKDTASQWLTSQKPTEWIDYNIAPGEDGMLSVPGEWQDAYQKGLEVNRDYWDKYRLGEPMYEGAALNPNNNTLAGYDPVTGYNQGLKTYGPENANRAIADMINKGRAATEDGFVAPNWLASEGYDVHQKAINQALEGLPNVLAPFDAQRAESATRNQQAYDVMTNKGQEGGIIPQDFSRPFYGQITGQEGVGGQGGPWEPQTQGMGWQPGTLGGLGQSSAAGLQNPMQQRDDTPASGWGGVFGQKNPWSLA